MVNLVAPSSEFIDTYLCCWNDGKTAQQRELLFFFYCIHTKTSDERFHYILHIISNFIRFAVEFSYDAFLLIFLFLFVYYTHN